MNVGNTVSHGCPSHKPGGFFKLALGGEEVFNGAVVKELCKEKMKIMSKRYSVKLLASSDND